MRRWVLVVIVLGLAGCGSGDNDTTELESASPTSAPTSILSGYSGPLLRTPDPASHAEDCSIDDPNGECGLSAIDIQENALPLSLTIQNLSGVMMGVPDGFEVVEAGVDKMIIETDDTETYPGDFFIIVEQGTSTEVNTLLNRYVSLDYNRRIDFQNHAATLNGYRLPNGDLGMVAIIELDGNTDQYLMMQGVVVTGYWPKYEATFIEMAESVVLAS
jgi:hypothetical protein